MRFMLVLSLLCFCAVLLSIGCAERTWTPYEETPQGVVILGDRQIDVDHQKPDAALARSAGCIECHKGVQDPHVARGFFISCVDCHGGDGLAKTIEEGHPQPRHPEAWPTSANPERTYALLNDEDPAWIRFVNPGDLRIANETCGGCHPEHVLNVQKSLMTNVAHFWGAAAYCNGVAPLKHSVFGESYSREGIPQRVNAVPAPSPEDTARRAELPLILPLPRFEALQPGNVLRVFERGSRLPNPLIGLFDKFEDPGRPSNRQSERGLGTQTRIDFPVLNIHKTRLNDPHLSFMGTNDNPGDYRSSGCTACHMVYANDRNPFHSGPYAKYGNSGLTAPDNPDPTIKKDQPGHPIKHEFTNGVPSSQCMVCHMHQPNSFVNSYYGFTMWTYEADGDVPGPGGRPLWPKRQKHPTHKELVEAWQRNPEEAAAKGNWIEPEYLKESAPALNENAKHTQFADYHGHGWMFRAVFKMDREGNLLDKDGKVIPYDTPGKFAGSVPVFGKQRTVEETARLAVHLKDVHAERGMHCVDCHFSGDVHGNGKLYGEYQAAIHVACKDCHGTVDAFADLTTRISGPAAKDKGRVLGDMRLTGGRKRFTIEDGKLVQHSALEEGKKWVVSQVRSSVMQGAPDYNAKAARAKLILRDGVTLGDPRKKDCDYAHKPEAMNCYSCHTSWITACFGCHLPQRGNIKVKVKHFEGDTLRQMATYNPQVVRDSEFMLGIAGTSKGHKVAPVRSSSAVMISAMDGKRRLTYIQQPTWSAPGFSSQAFNTHFPHTVRKTETRTCSDCHVSENEDNNAWMAQVMLLGTNSVGFMGHFAYVGMGPEGWSAVKVTEWPEPQALIGSHLHSMAYPEHFKKFKEGGRKLHESHHHGARDLRSLQLRGEYLYTANGADGFRVYDVANIANKDFSERVVTSPVSPLGQDTHVQTRYATAVALAFNNPMSLSRTHRPANQEQWPIHPLYRYAYVTDRHEGLILVDIDCLSDGEPRNNFLKRAVTFNPEGALNGAECLTVAGQTVWIGCEQGLVAVDVSEPMKPRIVGRVQAPDVNKPTSVTVQFRYAFVTDQSGLVVIDVTDPEKPVKVANVPIDDARDVYVAKTYAYVAAGAEGLVIVDVTRPREPKRYMTWDAEGRVCDLNMVKVATSYDSTYAYLADGRNGLHVVQIVGPSDGQPRSPFGWSPRPFPILIATDSHAAPALALSKALDRDRAVDENGNQVAVFGRIGGRPFNQEEMRKLYFRDGKVWRVSDEPPVAGGASAEARGPVREAGSRAGAAGGGR